MNQSKIYLRILLICVLLLLPLVAGEAFSQASSGEDASNIGWLAILPPLVAIALALVFREVVSALLLGIFIGSWLLSPADPLGSLLRVANIFFLDALADRGHAAIVLFTLMLGGMVGILSRAGGMDGIVFLFRRLAKGRRGGLVMTWLLGVVIFFDDYANTLLVGHTMRPFTDKLKISRAKLAYIVDSTAAPVASLAVISTWVGFEVGLLRDFTTSTPGMTDAYALFLQALPYHFYSIFTLFLVLSIALWNRDFGPMRYAELDALADNDRTQSTGPEIKRPDTEAGPKSVWIAIIPIATVICTTFVALYVSGVNAAGENAPLFEIIGASDSSVALMSASFLGLLSAGIMAGLLGKLKIAKISEGLLDGLRSMIPAMVILLLAWSLGEVCDRVGTAEVVIHSVTGSLPPWLIPAAVFFIAAVTAFSTGTSWGTMAILLPIALPLAHQIPIASGLSEGAIHSILLGSVGAVLAGATFGDHCSPISDTTILSSMASGCNHIAHVRTQIPYAMMSGILAIIVGYVPTGFGVPFWISLPVGLLVVAGIPYLFKKTE